MTDNADKNVVDGLELSRRSVVKTGAWAAPAILIASAVPALTPSGQDLLPNTTASFSDTPSNNSDKINNNAYTTMTVSRSDNYAGTITITSIVIEFTSTGWNNNGESAIVSGNLWEIDHDNSSIPFAGSAPYELVITPTAPSNGLLTDSGVFQVTWAMPKYVATKITAFGDISGGTADGATNFPIPLYGN